MDNTVYTIRDTCCICNSNDIHVLLENDLQSQLSLNMFEYKNKNPLIPYNILICNKCNSAQNKYLGDLKLVYESNHQDSFSKTKTDKHNLFKDFILENKDIKSICEPGAANALLANNIVKESNIEYNIIEPDICGEIDKSIKVYNNYFEDIDISKINSNCIVMSDMFEHFYHPLNILEKIKNSNIEYIILNHPDFDHAIKNFHCIILNIEHTFLIEHEVLFNLFNTYGFELIRRKNYLNFSLFLEFKRSNKLINKPIFNSIFNFNTKNNLINFINKMKKISDCVNEYMETNRDKKIYIWPCSVHSCTLFLFGLNYKRLDSILDNSPNKIGKYLDGYNLYCDSFEKIINSSIPNITIFISGANQYINELNLNKDNRIIFLENFVK